MKNQEDRVDTCVARARQDCDAHGFYLHKRSDCTGCPFGVLERCPLWAAYVRKSLLLSRRLDKDEPCLFKAKDLDEVEAVA